MWKEVKSHLLVLFETMCCPQHAPNKSNLGEKLYNSTDFMNFCHPATLPLTSIQMPHPDPKVYLFCIKVMCTSED